MACDERTLQPLVVSRCVRLGDRGGTDEVDRLNRVAQVRDDNAAAHNQRHVQCFRQLRVIESQIDALVQVVIDAVVAAQHRRCHETQQLLRPWIERAIFVCRAVESEEALDAQMIDLANARIHTCPVCAELLDAIGCVSGGGVGMCVVHSLQIQSSGQPRDDRVYLCQLHGRQFHACGTGVRIHLRW